MRDAEREESCDADALSDKRLENVRERVRQVVYIVKQGALRDRESHETF